MQCVRARVCVCVRASVRAYKRERESRKSTEIFYAEVCDRCHRSQWQKVLLSSEIFFLSLPCLPQSAFQRFHFVLWDWECCLLVTCLQFCDALDSSVCFCCFWDPTAWHKWEIEVKCIFQTASRTIVYFKYKFIDEFNSLCENNIKLFFACIIEFVELAHYQCTVRISKKKFVHSFLISVLGAFWAQR